MSRKKPENLSFEEALEELESLVAQLEADQLPLEQALKTFERGVILTQVCRKALDEAEQKVQILSKDHLDAEPEPFVPE